MNLVYYLLYKFFTEEKWNTSFMIILSFLINLFQTNGISIVTATIINSIQKNDKNQVLEYFKYFVAISIMFLILEYVYNHYKNKLMTKLRQWIRHELIKMILHVNNENFSDANFTYMANPINRISSVAFLAFTEVINYILPNISFLIIINLYFFYKNTTLGTIFMVGNVLVVLYLIAIWDSIIVENNKYEQNVHDADNYMLEILNNTDKIIYRGQTNEEIDIFDEKINNNINGAFSFYTVSNNHGAVMTSIAFAIMFFSVAFLISLYFKKKIDLTTFITIFTIILLYRDKIVTIISQLPDIVEFKGRAESVVKAFTNMHDEFENISLRTEYTTVDLPFDKIELENVSFKYKDKLTEESSHVKVESKQIFKKTNITIETNNKIIGITGLSGNGKSTFAKLILKLYKCDSGNISIDDVNIENISPEYIRTNITYVNQNSKLFDRKVFENMMYGCSDKDVCSQHLQEIMQYPKIKELYKKMDIYDKRSGAMGENLSGGQRQVVNIIGGLINPSKILILDEPTNALDPELKREVIEIINNFRVNKKCIMIITHDRDVYPLFDETIQI